MKISSLDRSIKDILSACFFEIPRIQRPYSWTNDNISDFLQDTIETNDSDYFIGSIVVYKKGNSSYGVVDGQQRITTITLILVAIRNIFIEIGYSELAQGIHTLIERCNINAEKVFVLRTETSFPYFQDCLLKFNCPEIDVQPGFEERNLQAAYQQILKFTKSQLQNITTNEDKKTVLISIRDKILELKVIFIELDQEEDAYVIFETLNTRGKELATSDLIKNLISRLIPPTNNVLDKVKLIWQEINRKIDEAPGQVTFSNYLQHYWLSKYEYTSTNKLYYSVKKYINKDNVNDLLNDLKKSSDYYRSFFEPSYLKWKKEENKIRDSIEAIDIFNVRSPLPLMISILSRYYESGITKKQAEGLLAALEKFIFAYTAITTTQSTGGLSKKYSKLAIKLRNAVTENEKNNIYNEVKDSLRENIPSLENFIPKFKELKYTEQYTKDRNLIRYILGKFYEKSNPLSYVDYRLMTIEHIIPQDQIAGSSDSLIGCLGNLILVNNELNQKLSNKSFGEKKKILIGSGYILDAEIINASKWSDVEINTRLDRMAIEAYRLIWKI
jgi:uncharacterized protein with ParB-like and HNH nuclease domain